MIAVSNLIRHCRGSMDHRSYLFSLYLFMPRFPQIANSHPMTRMLLTSSERPQRCRIWKCWILVPLLGFRRLPCRNDNVESVENEAGWNWNRIGSGRRFLSTGLGGERSTPALRYQAAMPRLPVGRRAIRATCALRKLAGLDKSERRIHGAAMPGPLSRTAPCRQGSELVDKTLH